MPSSAILEVPTADLREHPAVEAWRRFREAQAAPRRIFVLKPEKKRSAVYRMEGLGLGGTAVIAKRSRIDRLATEFLIYQEVLPRLPLPTLYCYGLIEDCKPGVGWLFLEDAGEQRYSAENEQHRALAGRWLGALHAAVARRPALSDCLPDRSLDYYQRIVALAGAAVCEGLTNPAFGAADLATLGSIRSICDVVQGHWSELEEVCRGVPETIVHGDFGAKNVRIRTGRTGLELLPLDWDSAGWGLPASDLSQVDVGTYRSVVGVVLPKLGSNTLGRIASAGRLFLALESITGEVEPLREQWIDNLMRKMRAYQSELNYAVMTLGWTA